MGLGISYMSEDSKEITLGSWGLRLVSSDFKDELSYWSILIFFYVSLYSSFYTVTYLDLLFWLGTSLADLFFSVLRDSSNSFIFSKQAYRLASGSHVLSESG